MRVAAVCVLLLLVTSGCVTPFRPRVDPDVVEGSPRAWEVETGKTRGGAFSKSVETLYTFDPPAGGPPFPATMQVFGLRSFDRASTSELLDRTRDAIEEASEAHNITLDRSQDAEGERVLHSGLKTKWLIREGVVADGDGSPLFDGESRVRLIGEVAHDGKSSTSVVVVGLAQVSRVNRGPLGTDLGETRDARTWIELVGDGDGSVAGAVSDNGFIDHLVTHG